VWPTPASILFRRILFRRIRAKDSSEYKEREREESEEYGEKSRVQKAVSQRANSPPLP
jgi:ribosomal protein S30